MCAILAGRDSQWRAYDVTSQLPDIRCYLSVQKGKADFALIAQGRKVMRNPKITEEPEDNALSHKWKKEQKR